LTVACNQSNRTKTPVSRTIIKEVFGNGKTKTKYLFPDSTDKRNYIEITFYESGNISEEKYRLDSFYHGTYKVYWDYQPKTLYYEAFNDHNKKIKYEKAYDTLGRLIKCDSLLSICSDSAFGCDALSITFYPNGKINYKYQRRNGLKNGFYYCYFENGKISFEATYKNDLENGVLKWYDESGKCRQTITAVDGKREGEADIIYETGIHGFGQYRNDEEDGLWIMKDTLTNKIIDTVYYRKGKKIN
jgi:antitoxin component YwqK of YwqJK toxin-antitoxin module